MAGYLGHTSTPLGQAAAFKDELAKEMSGHFVGPLSPNDFLNEFLPEGPEVPEVSAEAFSTVTNGRTEHDMYDSFIRATSSFSPNTVAFDTSNAHNAATLGPLTLKPDVSIYWKGNGPNDKRRKTRTDFSLMEMHVEFKKSGADDAFEDEATGSGAATTDQRFEKDTQSGRDQRGQLTAYALAQLSHQFRCFAFSLFITGKYVRFIRWDRAGAIVSSRFDYTECPLLLAKFLWNYSHLSPQQRGIDTTVTLACFDDRLEDEVRIRRILGLEKSVLLYRYGVPEDAQSQQERKRDEGQGDPLMPYYYYGPMPPRPTMSLIGRSTRSLPVVDLNKQDDDEAHVYLKDAWRIDAPPIEKEGDIYRLLHAFKVPHIMPFERGNDVVTHGYRTQTQVIALRIWGHNSRALTGYIHYRMVLGVVGTALTSFSSSKKFVSVIRDALIAHTHAFEDANILHRDISPSNIVDGPEGGYLIDWDLCKRFPTSGGSSSGTSDSDDLDHSPRRRDRTGTWQFMSAMILGDRSKVQGRVDDLESFLHVLSWVPIRYLDNTMTDQARSKHLRDVFDEVTFEGDVTLGGEQKRTRLVYGSYIPRTLAFKKPSPLLQLLKDIADVFKWRYIEIPEEVRQRYIVGIATLIPGTPSYVAFTADSTVHNHDSAMKKLADASWLLDTFNFSLSSYFTWPSDDEASLSWLPADATAPPVTYKRQLSHARTSELARASAYASTSSSHASRTSSKRGRSDSSDDEQVKRPKN